MILGSKDHGTKNDPIVLANSLSADRVDVEIIYWESIVVSIRTGDVAFLYDGQDIFSLPIDLVIATGWYKKGYQDLGLAFALVARSKGVKIWNSEIINQRSTTKLSMLVQLALADIPVADTTFSFHDTAHIDSQDLPFIAKAAAASRGEANFLVQTDEDRAMIVATNHREKYLIQPFLPNDHDLRIICFDGEPQLILKRMRKADAKTHLNNTSQGGQSRWLPIDTVDGRLLTKSKEICKIMSREMAGIDFIPDNASPFGYSCLEVNAIPQLTSGADVNIKMNALKETINKLMERSQ